MSRGTWAATRMEEHMAALLAKMDQQSAKMDQQNEQLQLLTKQQIERVESIAERQKEAEEHIESLAGDLESVKRTVDGRLGAVEDRQESLRRELLADVLRELAPPGPPGEGAPLHPSAPLVVPPDTSVSAGMGEVAGRGDSTGSRTGEATTHVEDGVAEGGSRRRGATSDEGGVGATGGAATARAGAPINQQQRPAPFDGKTTWDAYRMQFDMLAEINRWSQSEKAAYLAISLRGPAATVLTNLPPRTTELRSPDYCPGHPVRHGASN